jgi:AraC-like DNA-binding protein
MTLLSLPTTVDLLNGRALREKRQGTGRGRSLALLIDTRHVAQEDREESVYDAFVHASVPRQVSLSPSAVGSTRVQAWIFASARVFAPESPGMRVRRTPTLGPLDPMIALIVQTRGKGMFVQDAIEQSLMPGEIFMAGPTSSNDFLLSGEAAAFEVPFDEIGVPFETARKASERLIASPLLPLVTGYLMSLRQDADSIASGSGAESVGAATTLLVRALIVSAAEDDRYTSSALSDALLPRILAYVRQHLTDRNLTPAAIARAHNISLRHLYKLCNAADVRLMEWIIQERLEGARRTLTAPGQPPQPIASVAHEWGFKDLSHFSNRFRRAYGVSPRELQRHSVRQYRDQI